MFLNFVLYETDKFTLMNRRGGFQRGRQGKRVQRKIQNNNNNEPQKRKARQNFISNDSDRV